MMKKQIAAAVLALSATGGIGTGYMVNSWNDDKPEAKPTTSPTLTKPTPTKASTSTTATTPAPSGKPASKPTVDAPVRNFEIAPGLIGPVRIGMSKQQALATGLFNADVKSEVCGDVALLKWKSGYTGTFDVQTLGNGEITSIGVWRSGSRTQSGLGVGSTYAEIRAAIDDATAQEAGYGQSGVLNYDSTNGGWIGFLIDSPLDQLKGTDKVTFVEITKGAQPGLMRDGC